MTFVKRVYWIEILIDNLYIKNLADEMKFGEHDIIELTTYNTSKHV
jgi:hypothetical protein